MIYLIFLYGLLFYSMKHVQGSPNAALPAATHCNYVSGVAVTCQVQENLIKLSLFSVLFNFVLIFLYIIAISSSKV